MPVIQGNCFAVALTNLLAIVTVEGYILIEVMTNQKTEATMGCHRVELAK